MTNSQNFDPPRASTDAGDNAGDDAPLAQARKLLVARYGVPERLDARDALAALTLAVLERQATPAEARRALDDIREAGLLGVERLANANLEELQDRIAPAGHATRKAGQLRKLFRAVQRSAAGTVESFLAANLDELRALLAGVNGIGVETADWLLLRAAQAPTYPVDAATRRVLARHGWAGFEDDNETVREFVVGGLGSDAFALQQLHAGLSQVGRDHCGKTPHCTGCPLETLLPPGGPGEEP